MKVMILAAGVGERMRPLTDHTPKPLLEVAGEPLIGRHLRHLAVAGFNEVVINVSHLAQQITDYCGSGERWGMTISYSHEEEPLETAGGIQRALPLLGDAPFAVVNGDVWTDYPFELLRNVALAKGQLAHLVMVDSPPQHARGDFVLTGGLLQQRAADETGYTYAGIGLYTAQLFATMAPGKLALRPLLDSAIAESALAGEYYAGEWQDVGTPERLRELDAARAARARPPA